MLNRSELFIFDMVTASRIVRYVRYTRLKGIFRRKTIKNKMIYCFPTMPLKLTRYCGLDEN